MFQPLIGIIKLVGSGNFENSAGPGIFGGAGSPDISNLGISNGNLVNDRPWSAQVLNFCVSGNVSGSQAADFNNDVTNNDTTAACQVVNGTTCNACAGGGANFDCGTSQTTVNVPANSGNYKIEFVTSEQDTVNCKTYYYYCVSNNGATPEISHTVFGTDACGDTCLDSLTSNDVGTWTKMGTTFVRTPGQGNPQFGEDPTTGTCGVKFDEGITGNNVRRYFISVNGLTTPGNITFTIKAGQTDPDVTIPGPTVCDGPGCAAPNPILTKSFSPTTFVNGGTTTLTFTITNTASGSVAQSNLAFTDTLPSGLIVANPNGASTTCTGGMVTATAGGNTISLSGGTVGANSSCTVTVNVTNVPGQLNASCNGNPAAFTNSSTNISGLSGNLTNGVQPSCVTVTAPNPVLTKSFSPTTFVNGGTTTLTFTITNTATGSALQSNLSFTDTLPSGLRVATPNGAATTCGAGMVTAAAGGTTISLSGGSVAAGGTCTVTVSVTNVPDQLNAACGNSPNFTNTSANITAISNNLTNGVQPSCVIVTAPNPVLTKSFSPTTFVNGGTTTLTFTITNTAPGSALREGLTFTDTLPSGLIVATPPGIVTGCNGTVTAAAGGTTISLSSGSVAAGGTCSFSVNVTNVPGQLNPSCDANPPAFTNSASNISGLPSILTNGVQPSCVTVTAPLPVLTKSFSPTTFVNGGTTTLTFTITNTATGSVNRTGLGFTDTLPSGLIVATPNGIMGMCGPGSAVTATAGGNTITLANGTVNANSTCSFSVQVTNIPGQINPACDGNPAALTNSATNISGLSSNLTNGVQPSCVIVTAPNPTLTKSFSPTTFVNGGTTTLTFTINNTATGAVAQSGLAFTDTLPSNLRVAATPNTTNTCGAGMVTAAAGGTTISLSGGTVAAGGTCTFSVDVTNVPGQLNASCDGNPAAFTNSAGNISNLSSNLNNGVTPSCVIVTAPTPVLTKSFSPNTFINGGTTTLTFTITNTGTGSVMQSGLAFTDTLPSGLLVANPSNAATTCTSGTVTAAAGGNTISLSGASVGANSSCTVTVSVTNVPGQLNASCSGNPAAFTNSSVNISGLSSNLTNGVQPSCVTVTGPNPTLTKSFSPTTFVNGGTTTLTFTISNTATVATNQMGLSFTDTLPSGLQVANPSNAATTCTGGMATATAGSSTISLSGASVAAGGTCTVTVSVTNVPGQLNASCDTNPAAFTNTSANITAIASNLNNGVTPSCVTVTAPNPTLTKSFNPTTFVNGGTTTLTFTITNTATGSAAQSGLAFTDTLPSGLIVANPNGAATTCTGGMVTATPGSNSISLSGGSVGANSSCTVTVTVTNVLDQLNAACPNANFTNSATSISGLSSNLTNGVQPSCVTVTAPDPVLTKSFSPTTFVNGGTTTLTFTINNTGASTVVRSGLAFTDTLPSGLIVANPATVVSTCGGMVTATPGSNTITLASGTVGDNTSCTISVQVTNVPGQLNSSCPNANFTNSATSISGLSGLSNGVTPSCVTVTGPNPTLTKSFSPTTFANGGTTTLTFTISNTATGSTTQSNLAFTDTLPSGLIVATPSNAATTCTGGAVATTNNTISLSGGTVAANSSCTVTVSVTNVSGQTNPSCDTNPAAFTNTAGNITAISTNLTNGVQPNCVIVTSTPPGPSPKGPGLPYPDDAEVSDQKAGSVLVYPIYTSNSANPTTQNTRISITNVDPNRDVAVHLFFVDGATCSIADAIICLTANQTASFLTSDLDPGTTGYLIAIASDLVTGCPIKFNCLIGDEYVKFASGHQANLGAEAFAAIAATPAACDGFSLTARLNFDGVSYNRVPRVLAASNVPSRVDGNDTLLILNRFGGNLATGAATISDIFGNFYDDAENAVSFGFNPGVCQFRSSLSNNFPRTTPRLENFITAGRSGWFRLFSTNDIGLLGATLNFNPNAGSSPGAFNQGHNLHKLTLTSTQTLIVPIITPNCR